VVTMFCHQHSSYTRLVL